MPSKAVFSGHMSPGVVSLLGFCVEPGEKVRIRVRGEPVVWVEVSGLPNKFVGQNYEETLNLEPGCYKARVVCDSGEGFAEVSFIVE